MNGEEWQQLQWQIQPPLAPGIYHTVIESNNVPVVVDSIGQKVKRTYAKSDPAARQCPGKRVWYFDVKMANLATTWIYRQRSQMVVKEMGVRCLLSRVE